MFDLGYIHILASVQNNDRESWTGCANGGGAMTASRPDENANLATFCFGDFVLEMA